MKKPSKTAPGVYLNLQRVGIEAISAPQPAHLLRPYLE
jgi:hypothetical protein